MIGLGILDNEEFEIECPECGEVLTITVSQVGGSVICPKCKTLIHLEDDGFTDSIDDAENQINDLLNDLS